MKIVAFVQARMGSSRLPGKVLKQILDYSMIEILLSRLSRSKELDQIVVATTTNSDDDELYSHVSNLGYHCTRGREKDVLNRFYEAAKAVNADVIVRITADCPLVDPELVDECIRKFKESEVDYVSNTSPPTYPDGLDVEVVSFSSIEHANGKTESLYDREHVTPFVRYSDIFSKSFVNNSEDLSSIRITVDEPEDLEVVSEIFEYFSPNIHFGWHEIISLKDQRPEIFKKNKMFKRNEGSIMSNGQKVYKRAKRVIPGGTMLLSKRPEMFLPEKWPSYFTKAKGVNVWDLDGRKYVDMIMGIGPNALGYGNSEVDNAVREAISNGNMSTFSCFEEVELAERLVALHPWSDMVRFARSGGEANAMAIRIARAASENDNVAICGYHGWHDWYLSVNLSGNGLDKHLLPGLNPRGVPSNLKDSVFPFEYNNFNQLEKLVDEKNIGVIKMEVQRRVPPKDNFLEKVRELSTRKNIVLIFDECTSGFRETFGGLHKKYNVNPDMAMFGKTMGNGYAVTAVIGTRDVMDFAQRTFISSTFWTERIGSVAALKTIEVMENIRSWEKLPKFGKKLKERLQNLASHYNLEINISGIDPLPSFVFNSENHMLYKTFITQEMLKKGFLASNIFYISLKHDYELLDKFFLNLEPVFNDISDCERGLKDINQLLESPISQSGFSRLN